MDADEDRQQRELIAANVRLAIDEFGTLTDFDFDLGAASVEWVEGYLERQREQGTLDPENADGFIGVLGSFLGQSIIAAVEADHASTGVSAEWAYTEEGGGWGVRFSNGSTAFPFAKVAKQFRDGREAGESITSFYRFAVEKVATGGLSESGD